MRKIIQLSLLFIITIFISCNNETNTKNDTQKERTDEIFLYPCGNSQEPLNFISYQDTFKIFMEYPDCGEWGGHQEKIFVYKNFNSEYFARIIIDSVNCDIINDGYYSFINPDSRNIFIDTLKMINIKEQKMINLFIEYMVNRYLITNYGDHSGVIFNLLNTDSTFFLHSYRSSYCTDSYYSLMRNNIFGVDKLKIWPSNK